MRNSRISAQLTCRRSLSRTLMVVEWQLCRPGVFRRRSQSGQLVWGLGPRRSSQLESWGRWRRLCHRRKGRLRRAAWRSVGAIQAEWYGLTLHSRNAVCGFFSIKVPTSVRYSAVRLTRESKTNADVLHHINPPHKPGGMCWIPGRLPHAD